MHNIKKNIIVNSLDHKFLADPAIDAHMQGVPCVMLKMNAPAYYVKTTLRTLKIKCAAQSLSHVIN